MRKSVFQVWNQDAAAGVAVEAAPVAAVAEPVAQTASESVATPAEPQAAEPVVAAEADTVVAATDVEKKADEPIDPWNGEVESLEAAEWYKALEESKRAAVAEGLKAKLKQWESGYGKKFQETADARKQMESELEKAREEIAAAKSKYDVDLKTLMEMLGSDDAKAAQTHYDAELEKLRAATAATVAELTKELDELRTFRSEAETRETKAREAAVSAEVARIQKEYADILEVDAAADAFEKMMAAGMEEDAAAKFVRSNYVPKKPTLPGAAENASRGDGPRTSSAMPSGLSWNDQLEWHVNRAAEKIGGRG